MKNLLYSLCFTSLVAITLSFTFSDGEKWIAPEGAKKLLNPLQSSKTVIGDGKYLFKQNCQSCHGDFGKGNGEVAKVLKAKCADLTSKPVQLQADGELFYKISIGRVEMPSFKDILDSKERWAIVLYMRTLAEDRELTGSR